MVGVLVFGSRKSYWHRLLVPYSCLSTTFLSFHLLYDVTTLGSCHHIPSMTAGPGRGLPLFKVSAITIAGMEVKVNIRPFASLAVQLRSFSNKRLADKAWIAVI